MGNKNYRKYFTKKQDNSGRFHTRMAWFFLAVALVSGAWAWSSFGQSQQDVLTIYSDSGSHSFHVELADTPEEQATGLMFRDSLGPTSGMLFVFPEPQPVAFWMKNTLIPLDMLFIDERSRIVGIAKMAQPHSLDAKASPSPVVAVLEILGGRSDELGISAGDLVDYAKVLSSATRE